MRAPLALACVLLLATAGCSDKASSDASSTPVKQHVRLSYTVPSGMKEVAVPSASPGGGMVYDIRDLQSSTGCELRVVRLLLPRSDGSEDQDATYNMLGAIMKESGITHFSTNGMMVPGTPGPVPMLVASGRSAQVDLRAAGRMSNGSLQGWEIVMGCPRGKLVAKDWDDLLASLHVDGFTGSLEEH